MGLFSPTINALFLIISLRMRPSGILKGVFVFVFVFIFLFVFVFVFVFEFIFVAGVNPVVTGAFIVDLLIGYASTAMAGLNV